MCGIGGFVSARPLDRYTAKLLATSLLLYSAERGNQSAGIYCNGVTTKKAMSPGSFIDLSDFANAFTRDTDLCLVHTRMPTCGGTGDAQAQPFQVNATVAVHNGMYFDPGVLKRLWSLKKPSGVDSELVARFVESYGVKRLPSFLSEADGLSAIAVVWKGQLYAIRWGNPLAYASLELADGNRVTVFASTRDILVKALAYVWPCPPHLKVRDLPEGALFHMLPGKARQLGKKIGTHWKSKLSPYSSRHSWEYDMYGDDGPSEAEAWWWNEKRKG